MRRPAASHSMLAIGMLIAGVLIRSGSVPVHCWMTDLFENATLGTALLFVTPMVGAYAAVRLVLPIAAGLGAADHRAAVAVHRPVRRRHGTRAARSATILLLPVPEPFVAGAGRSGNGHSHRPDRRTVRLAVRRNVAGRFRADAASAGITHRSACRWPISTACTITCRFWRRSFC